MKDSKKAFLTLAAIIISGIFLAACASAPQKANTAEAMAKEQCVPEWEVNPPTAEDGVYGSGLAKKHNAALSKKTADARARDDVVQSIQVKVQNLMKDFLQEAGIGNDAQSLEFSSSVSKQVASHVLYGCKIVKRQVCPDGTWHSLALWPSNSAASLKEEIGEKVKDQIKNEYALYNEFKAKNGFEELQKELDQIDFTK